MFKVKDDLAGAQVACQVCGATVAVPEPGQEVQQPPAATPAQPPPPSSPQRTTAPCPSCAEPIPANAIICPYCKEEVTPDLSPEQQRTRLAELLKSVQSHDAQGIADDDMNRGGFFAVKTIVVGIISALSLLLIAVGAASANLSGLIVLGVILLIIFGIAFLVSVNNDYQASHIHDAPSAAKALSRYLKAAQTNRQSKAYYALAPLARKNAPVQPPKLDKIPGHTGGPSCVDDLSSFKDYVKTIFRGPSSQSRTVQIKKTRVVAEHDAFAVVETEVHFQSYPSWVIITILISPLICVLLIVILTKREKYTIRKLSIRHDGRWYIADPGYEGAIDRVAADACANL